MKVGIEACPAETRFLLCRDKVIKQHRSQLYQELTNMSRSEASRLTLPSTSIICMSKPYSDMYTHHCSNIQMSTSPMTQFWSTDSAPMHMQMSEVKAEAVLVSSSRFCTI